MTRTQLLVITATLATMAGTATAQTKMTVRPESQVTLAGSSNLHAWACNTSSFNATIELDSNYLNGALKVAKPITKVVVTIPVKSLKCGHGKMDDNMYKALNANAFPEIRYVLSTYEIDKERTTADSLVARTYGELSVAGQTVKVEIPIVAERKTAGAIEGAGTVKLRMTDFGINPPTAMLGMLKTGNDIEIKFRVLLDKAAIVALTR